MYTPTKAYSRKISSGLLLTVLALSAFAALFVIAPAVPSAKAANAQFGASFTYPFSTINTAITRAISLSDPAGNAGITEVDISIPLAAAQTVTAGSCTAGHGFINGCLGTVSGVGPWTVVYASPTSGDTVLAQGSTGYLNLGFETELAESTTGVVDVYSLAVIVSYSNGATQTSTLSFYEGQADAVTVVATTAPPYTAGSSVSVTATVAPADQGVPITWSLTAPAIPSTFTATFAPTSGFTSAAGATTSSLTSTYASAGYIVSADAGTLSAYGDAGGNLAVTATAAFTYLPASPTEVSVTIPPWSTTTTTAPYYVSAVAPEDLVVALADKYGNAVDWATVIDTTGTFKATAIAGTIALATGTIADNGVFSVTPTYAPISPTTAAVLPYGSYDVVTVSLTVSSGTYAGTYTGSGSLVIGYLGSVVGTPGVNVYDASTDVGAPCNVVTYCPEPGTPVGLSFTTTQTAVPVNFTLTAITSTYTGTFSNGLSWIVVDSGSNGIASANFTSDTLLGDIATAAITINEPTTAAPTTPITSLPTKEIGTGYGSPAELVIGTFFDSALTEPSTYVAPVKVLYVDVSLADAYGNIVANPTASAYQITLVASAGSLSATTTYIEPGVPGTFPNFVITYTAPSTIGTVTLSASTTAYGIKATAEVISVVSIDPVVSLTPPVTTSFASTATYTATINATAIPSLATTPGTAIVEFQYSLNGAALVVAPITATNSTAAAFTAFTVTLNQGTNTITISATDSSSNTGSATFTFTVSKVVTTPITFTTPGAASEVFEGTTGDEVNFTNTGVAQSVNVFIVWYNSANQVVSSSAQLNVNFATGQKETFFNAYSASGTYTVQNFVRSATGNAISQSYAATVTIP